MPPAKLDDAAHLSDLLTGWGSPASLHASLVAAGFDTVGKLAFAVSDGDAAAVPAFLHKVLDPSGGTDPATLLTASAACLRRAISHAKAAVAAVPPAPAPAAASVPGASATKLTPVQFRDLKSAYLAAYPGELLTPEHTPSVEFLSTLKSNLESAPSCWVPWRHRLSESDVLAWQEHRKPRSDSQLFRALLSDDSEPAGPTVAVNMGGPVEPTVRRALSLMASAIAMLQESHLVVAKRFNEKFLSHALAKPSDPSLRPPSLAEILHADRAVWASVTALMREHSWSLSDSLNEIAFVRQDIASLLQPRPRPPPPQTPRKADVPPKKRDQPQRPNPGKGNNPSPKSASAPKSDEADVPTPPPPKKPKRDTTSGFDTSWVRQHDGKEICLRYSTGKCTSKTCRFLHVCPIPDASGKACGQPRPASKHSATPH